MSWRFWAGVLLLAVGCQTTRVAVPDPVPGPFDVGGVKVVFDDARPGWERSPFAGPVSLHRLGRVYPNPWAQLAKETEAVVAALPEKPARVEVTVVSFRLINKEQANGPPPDPSDNVQIGKQPLSGLNNRANAVDYERLKSATAAGDVKGATTIGTGLVFQNGDPSIGVVAPQEKDDGPGTAFDEHPAGASCRVRAVVRLVYPDGRDRRLDVRAVAPGENTSGSKYYGEALDAAVANAVRQFGFQFRQGVGPPPGG